MSILTLRLTLNSVSVIHSESIPDAASFSNDLSRIGRSIGSLGSSPSLKTTRRSISLTLSCELLASFRAKEPNNAILQFFY